MFGWNTVLAGGERCLAWSYQDSHWFCSGGWATVGGLDSLWQFVNALLDWDIVRGFLVFILALSLVVVLVRGVISPLRGGL